MPEYLQGKRLVAHVATSQPSAPEDPADTEYTRAGEIVDYSDSSSWSTTNITTRDSGGFEQPTLDTLSQNGTFNVNRIRGTEEASHVTFRDAHLDETEVYLLLTVEDETGTLISGQEGKHTTAYITDWSTDGPLSGGAEYSFDFQATAKWTTVTFT